MSDLVVVAGPPGAGKSTVARLLVERFEPSVLVEGDAFFGFLRRGAIPPWLPESDEQNEIVTRAAASAAGRYAAGGFTTVYDGVVGPWFLPTFAVATGLAEVHYVVLLPPVEACVERVATRQNHGFADEPATRKMHDEFTRAELDPRHVLAEPDPPGDPKAVVERIVAALATGVLRYPI